MFIRKFEIDTSFLNGKKIDGLMMRCFGVLAQARRLRLELKFELPDPIVGVGVGVGVGVVGSRSWNMCDVRSAAAFTSATTDTRHL